MPNPAQGFSTAYNERIITHVWENELPEPVALLELHSVYPELFEKRLDTEEKYMLLCDEETQLRDENDNNINSVPVGYVGSTPIHI